MAPSACTVLCSKALTHSDVTTEIAKSGRLVLPRAQVVSCLPRLLHLGGGGSASTKPRPGGPTPAIPLFMYDTAGKLWRFQMKTWHNVVTCGGRATYVLENTAGFVHEHGLRPGMWLAICEQDGRLVLRTDMGGVLANPKREVSAGSMRGAAPPSSPARHHPPSGFERWAMGSQMCPTDAGLALVRMQCASSSDEFEGGGDAVAPAASRSAGSTPGPMPPPLVIRPLPVHGAVWVQQTLPASAHHPASWSLTCVPSSVAPGSGRQFERASALRLA